VAEAAALPALADALAPLGRYPGVFVFGSNDYYKPLLKSPLRYFTGHRPEVRDADRLPAHALRALLEGFGWLHADNRRFVLDVDGRPVEIRGTGDAHMGWDDYGAVAGPPDPSAALALGVTHAPYRRVLDAMAGDGVALILAGHTHGGQMWPFHYAVSATQPMLDGVATIDGVEVVTSRGVGGWGPPLRVLADPEIVLVTLHTAG